MELEALDRDPEALRSGVLDQLADRGDRVRLGGVPRLEGPCRADLEDRHRALGRRPPGGDHEAGRVDHDATAARLPVAPADVLADADSHALRPLADHGGALHRGYALADPVRDGGRVEREQRSLVDVRAAGDGERVGGVRALDRDLLHAQRGPVDQPEPAVAEAADYCHDEHRQREAAPGQARQHSPLRARLRGARQLVAAGPLRGAAPAPARPAQLRQTEARHRRAPPRDVRGRVRPAE